MTRTNDNEELNRFKKTDPRLSLLPAMGWMHEPKDGDKDRYVRGSESIHVFRGDDGTWITRSGTTYRNVIQLAQEISGGNLGQARKFIRSILGSEVPASSSPSPSSPLPAHFSSRLPISSPLQPYPSPETPAETETKRTLAEIKAEIDAESVPFDDKPIVPYLLQRGFTKIPPIFRRAMRVDKDGARFKNVSFLYYLPTEDGGVELVSRERKGSGQYEHYLKGTRAGVWIAAPKEGQVDHIVIGEAPLDCISSREICGDGDQTAYFAVRRGAEDACVELVCRLIKKCGQGARIEIRTDNDTAGFIYAAKLSEGFGKRKPEDFGNRKLVARYTSPPDSMKDWTEVQEARFAAHQKSA